jgi:hypothetical protein
MTDYLFGVARPNFVSNTGVEAITSNMEFYSVSTAIDIRTYVQGYAAAVALLTNPTPTQLATAAAAATASQLALNKLIEIVSLRGQPVIMGAVTGTGPYVISLVSEHAGGWFNASTAAVQTSILMPDARAGEDLLARIGMDGINYGFTTSNTTVTFNNPQILT